MLKQPTGCPAFLLTAIVSILTLAAVAGADQPQWGQRHSRNMISDEVGLPERFDPKTGENVKWSVEIGTQCWATPVVAGGQAADRNQ